MRPRKNSKKEKVTPDKNLIPESGIAVHEPQLQEVLAKFMHDLSNPILVAKFCVWKIQQDPESIGQNPKIMSHLEQSIQKIEDLTKNLNQGLNPFIQ